MNSWKVVSPPASGVSFAQNPKVNGTRYGAKECYPMHWHFAQAPNGRLNVAYSDSIRTAFYNQLTHEWVGFQC